MVHRVCYIIAATSLAGAVAEPVATGRWPDPFTIACSLGCLFFGAVGCAVQVIVHWHDLVERLRTFGRFARGKFHAATKEPVRS